MNHLFSDFYNKSQFKLKALPPHEPDIEEIRQKFEAWKLAFLAEEDARREAEMKLRVERSNQNGWRLMPHLPDPRSMELQREDSIERRKKNDAEGPLAEARAARNSDFFKTLSSACFIEGYTDYLVNRPLPEVVSRLRRGCDHAAQALEFGFTAHAWQINDYLHEAIAVDHFKLAQTVIRLRQSEWDTNRIRPVNWLITRIRIVMDLFLKKEADLQVLLENERKGLFEEKLPSELDPDLPEMRNFYELLRALVEKKETAFNQALAARMPIREAHFQRGGTVAPIALLDVHGLALCRLARKRGLKPQASHVYLPLEILDLEN
ncbi:MAG: Imm49 family immunity protein [Nibricoccus sp.]